MFDLLSPQIKWHIIFAAVCLLVVWRGRRPERITVGFLLAANIVTVVTSRENFWKPIEPTLVAIDSCVALFFVGLALISSRWWPLWAAAFHLLAVIMLVVNALDPAIRPYAYYVGEQIWDYLGLIALLIGALLEGRRAIGDPSPHQASSNASAR